MDTATSAVFEKALSQRIEAIKKAAKQSGVPTAASVLKRQPFGPRDGFELALANTCEAKVHTLTPVPYIFRPLERASDYSSRLA